MIVTENQLDEWVRGNARDAQGVIVELVWRLVAASSPRPRERRFPLGDSIGQHGPDGVLEVQLSLEPFVPEGRSYWEIGTGIDAGGKATDDYSGLVKVLPEEARREATFVFVTPLSGRRNWEHTWKEDAQGAWIATRRERAEWRDVRVIDGTKLVDWLHQFPAVELWLSARMRGLSQLGIETLEQHWQVIREVGAPPPLTEAVFLANRDDAIAKVQDVFVGNTVQVRLTTHFPSQVIDFVSACLASMKPENQVDVAGRCILVSSVEAWNLIVSLQEKHILVAAPTLDLSGDTGLKLIQKARLAGHSLIFGSAAGGVPDPSSVALPGPRSHQLKDALEKSGYGEERARSLAQRTDGNLSSLLRLLQNLCLLPDWSSGGAASDLAIAALLGSWSEISEADRAVVEDLSGKAFGEWIEKMREVALLPGTPLVHRDGLWRFSSRYEGWHALGSRIFDEHLERLRTISIRVLSERDPKFELPSEERYMAAIHGKVLSHSAQLRTGLAESLAILGSYPEPLTSSSLGKGEHVARSAVREIFQGADWLVWASLDGLLPLLAEAAPAEFLEAVEMALASEERPFEKLLAEEGDTFMGATYMSGLLWSLETLAWSPDHLGRVVLILGDLRARDPGGRWGNRPGNSLSTILLPWYPQTTAPVLKRKAAVASLLREFPEVGWNLLLSLLPSSHATSMGTRRPEWRRLIPDAWSAGVTRGEYREQIDEYFQLALTEAKADVEKLASLVARLDDLPAPAQEALLDYLSSGEVVELSQDDRLRLWTVLVDMTTRHTKYSHAAWAMDGKQVERIAAIAARIAPESPGYRHRRLFSERDLDLFESSGDFDSQQRELDARRQAAVEEVAAAGGPDEVLRFAGTVESPWRVGLAYGAISHRESDSIVLPKLLSPGDSSSSAFAGGYIWSRFRKGSWAWVDELEKTTWNSEHAGQFFAFLPFERATWERVQLLGVDQGPYWRMTGANAHQAGEGLEYAIEQLIERGRPVAAVRCLGAAVYSGRGFDATLAVRALLGALTSTERTNQHDTYEMVEVIKALQGDPLTNPADLFQVEWAYLALLERHRGASPKLLWGRLSTEPEFFCEVIRLVFRSKFEEGNKVEAKSDGEQRIARNAYRLLSEWRRPPGLAEDGTFDGHALQSWLEQVEKIAKETGHYEVAMTMVGHSLVSVPADPGGLWIDRGAAAALNAKDGNDLRSGFSTELFNSRGAHGFTEGREELELAAKFRAQADAVETEGFQRLAATLRELAETYERFSARERSRGAFED